MKIYTRGGDAGETALFDGTRVPKSDARVDAYGDVDELNALIGLVRALKPGADLDDMLAQIQGDLMALGSRLADPRGRIAARVGKAILEADDVARLETWIDRLEADVPPLRRFILAGGSVPGAQLHVARTVCRRAERRIVGLAGDRPEPLLVAYINRLSDLLFVMARTANHRAGVPELEW